MKKTNTTVHISGFPIFNDKHELKYAVACDRDIQQLETVKDQHTLSYNGFFLSHFYVSPSGKRS